MPRNISARNFFLFSHHIHMQISSLPKYITIAMLGLGGAVAIASHTPLISVELHTHLNSDTNAIHMTATLEHTPVSLSFSPAEVLMLKTALDTKSPEQFLSEDGEKIAEKILSRLERQIQTPAEKAQFLSAIDDTLMLIERHEVDFEAQVDENGLFRNPEYEHNWSPVHKFLYRQEKRIPGFTQWTYTKLSEYRNRTIATNL